MQCFSKRAKDDFFPKLGSVGFFFQAKDLGGNSLPSLLQSDSSPIALQLTVSKDYNLLYMTGMHLLCRELKKADWFGEEYRAGIKDKVDSYFDCLRCPAADLSGKLSAYGNTEEAAKQADELRKQYTDVVSRSYFAAYVALCPSLEKYLTSPQAAYDNLKATVLTSNYKMHGLPLTVDAANDPNAELLKMHLAILRDKIILLLLFAGKLPEDWHDKVEEVDKIINELATATNRTGLYNPSNTEISAEVITLP